MALMATEILALLKVGFDVTKATREIITRDKPDHRLNDQICSALRAIYFAPDGVLALLNELAKSSGAPSEQLRERLLSFNDREWEVERALGALDFKRLQNDLRLTLATMQTLELIRAGKISLRRSIQAEINYYGQRGVKPDLDEIRRLIAGIERLNKEILEVERLINARAVER